MADEHIMMIGTDFMSGFYEAECTCGWEDRQQYTTRHEAEDAWENHCDVVFMEATGG